MTGLRERKKADTRRALSDAALKLAFERGLDSVTREDIADVAGVSLRTFNNYFTGKYEAIAYRQIERIRRSTVLLRQRPADEPLWTSITEAVLEPLETEAPTDLIPSRGQVADIRKLLLTDEVRDVMAKEVFADCIDVIAERTGTDPVNDLYPRLVAAVVRAVAQAAMDAYATADPPRPITVFLRQGFAAVAAGLPEPGTQPEGKKRG